MRKRTKISLVILTLLVLLTVFSGIMLHQKTYTAENSVSLLIKENKADITIKEQKNAWQVLPINKSQQHSTAIIFYPGGLVTADSYLPLAVSLAQYDYPVYIAKMPLNLAVLKSNAADEIIADNQLTDFVIGGHSLGGTMASRYAHEHQNKHLKGVFFLASYPDEKGELLSSHTKVLSITGSKDGVLNQDNYQAAKSYLPNQTVYYSIVGGNHSGFGSYGQQKGDNIATISNEQQQQQITSTMIEWLNEL